MLPYLLPLRYFSKAGGSHPNEPRTPPPIVLLFAHEKVSRQKLTFPFCAIQQILPLWDHNHFLQLLLEGTAAETINVFRKY